MSNLWYVLVIQKTKSEASCQLAFNYIFLDSVWVILNWLLLSKFLKTNFKLLVQKFGYFLHPIEKYLNRESSNFLNTKIYLQVDSRRRCLLHYFSYPSLHNQVSILSNLVNCKLLYLDVWPYHSMPLTNLVLKFIISLDLLDFLKLMQDYW